MIQFVQEEQDTNRYVHYFEDEITRDSVQNLIDILTPYPSIDLFICTPGGEAPGASVLMHFVNTHPDIKIFLTGYIASAGTFFLIDCDAEVVLTDQLDWILFHQGDREFGGRFRKQMLDSKILEEQIKEFNNTLADKYKRLGLTSKEIKDYFKGEDVILYRKDFARLKTAK